MPVHLVMLIAEHWPQAPLGWHAGEALGHCASLAQGWQTWTVVLQTGVRPPQFAFEVHGTQVAVETSQAGVAPAHFVALVAEQTAQAPLAWQAGVALGHWLSAVQAWQRWAVVLQTGVAPPHWAFETHGTQLPAVVLQTGVVLPHWLAFVAEHWPHAPAG